MKIPNLQRYIELYNEEKVLFTEVGPLAKQRGYLLFNEFYQICMWKSRRPKQKYLKNKQMVEDITRKAFKENDESKKIGLLCRLKGIAIPTASAILTVVFPEKYAVIDVRCIEILRDLGYDFGKTINPDVWVKYVQVMREIADENDITPRQLDMAFFAMHKEKLDSQEFRNLYPIKSGKIVKIQ